MLRNYFLTAVRNFLRNKTYTVLSLAGLTLGASCVIAIYSFLTLQLSYDKHQSHLEQVYRVVSHWKSGDDDVKFATVPHPLSGAIKSEIPGIEAATNLYSLSAQVNIPQEGGALKKLKEEDIGFAYQDVFEILDFEWVAGSSANALSDVNSVVISTATARKFFDINNEYDRALGRIINLGNKHDLVVKGVYQDFPKSTDFPFNMVAYYEAQEGVNAYFGEGKIWDRLNGNTQALIKLNSQTQESVVEAGIKDVVEKNNTLDGYSVFLQPLSQVHTTDYGTYSGMSLEPATIRVIVALAVLLIVISSINFINISTARAVKRAKEVGIRKVLGGHRPALIAQFLLESFIIVALAHGVSFLIADVMLGAAGDLIDYPMTIKDVPLTNWIVFCAISITAVSLLSGLYPAFVLSGFSPLTAIRTKISNIDKQSKFPLRKVLVGSQFAVSIGLIMGTIIVIFQLDYFRSQDMGFRKDGIVTIQFPEPDLKRSEVLKTELLKHPEIAQASLNLGGPLASTNNTGQHFSPEKGEDELFTVNVKEVDENYLDLFDIKLLAGRNVNATDTYQRSPEGESIINQRVVVTETLIRKMGIFNPQEALGKLFQATWGGKFQIVGVVEEFNANSLHQEAVPVMMNYGPNGFYELSIALASTDPEAGQAAVAIISEEWEKVFPELLIEYNFLDQRVANQYRMEDVMGKVMRFFALMAIVICAIGLYGLTDYMANAKRKEIGIRKVVGASVGQILNIFTKEILVVLSVAFLISATGTFLGMQKWLESYAYHITIGWEIVAISLGVTLLVTLVTMGYRSYTAARLNMVDVLKDE
ncbi:ABC transporter permease [Imperialibacter roseus]|uniref:ABC transporter permease n=1 Tax=Imperialibacter roseus TaxID=1324217 RepID=A0ABZ0IJZ6_9BACT|nr:ABC transporter permease [Imperialibacter roseus]WOK04857.1 ABC transporter permease [Imperialibacter roseus]